MNGTVHPCPLTPAQGGPSQPRGSRGQVPQSLVPDQDRRARSRAGTPTSSASSSPHRMSLSKMSWLWWSRGWQGWQRGEGAGEEPVSTRPPPRNGSCPRATRSHLEPQQAGGQQLEQQQGLVEQLVLAQRDAGGAGGRPQEGQHLQQQGTDGAGCRQSGASGVTAVSPGPKSGTPVPRCSPPTASLAKTGSRAALCWPSSLHASTETLGTTRTSPRGARW